MFLKELPEEHYLTLLMARAGWRAHWLDPMGTVGWITVRYEEQRKNLIYPEFLEFDGVKYAMLYNAGSRDTNALILILGYTSISDKLFSLDEILEMSNKGDLCVKVSASHSLEVVECS